RYQTLIGVWPLAEEPGVAGRVKQYMTKALREAKERSQWTAPDEAYEGRVHALIDAMLDERKSHDLLYAFRTFHQRIARLGLFNSLSQTVLRLLAPGVPDTYQGTDLWDFSLVDPDNRRPVDYARRTEMLRVLQDGRDAQRRAEEALRTLEDGRAKL